MIMERKWVAGNCEVKSKVQRRSLLSFVWSIMFRLVLLLWLPLVEVGPGVRSFHSDEIDPGAGQSHYLDYG